MRPFQTFAVVAAAAAVLGAAGAHPDPSGPEWHDAFNRDLSNAVCAKPGWTWDAGGCLTPGTHEALFTRRDYGPFVLDCEYTLAATGNSGIFIYDTAHPTHKIEVQLLDDRHPNYRSEAPYQNTGALYGRCAPVKVNSRAAGETNRLTIVAAGKDIEVILNGETVLRADISRWTDPDVNPDGTKVPRWHKGFPALGTIPRHGRIGLQGLHGGAPVRFNYIRVKEL